MSNTERTVLFILSLCTRFPTRTMSRTPNCLRSIHFCCAANRPHMCQLARRECRANTRGITRQAEANSESACADSGSTGKCEAKDLLNANQNHTKKMGRERALAGRIRCEIHFSVYANGTVNMAGAPQATVPTAAAINSFIND